MSYGVKLVYVCWVGGGVVGGLFASYSRLGLLINYRRLVRGLDVRLERPSWPSLLRPKVRSVPSIVMTAVC